MRSTLAGIVACLLVAACATSAPGPAEPPQLTEEHGCGYGFFLSDRAQTAGLFIEYADFEAAQDGRVPESSQLSGGPWTAKLEFGADLFSNWCDDVIEPDEPTRSVDEIWLVTGTVEITGLPPAGQCGPASAALTGLEARNDGGSTILLGDLVVENEFWGCFAG